MRCTYWLNVADLFQKLIFIFVIAVVIATSFTAGKEYLNADLHPDEMVYSYYAGELISFIKLFKFGIKNNVIWSSSNRYDLVPVGLYWIGLTIYFTKYRSMLVEPKRIWIFTGPHNMPNYKFDIESHPIPYLKELIYLLRQKMRIYRSIYCLFLFIIAWYLGRYYCAIPAIYFTVSNKFFLSISSLVLLETIFLFQHLLNILLIFFYFLFWQQERSSIKRLTILAIFIGITAGLLTGTKIHGIINVIIYTLCLLFLMIKQFLSNQVNKKHLIATLLHMIIAVLICFLILIILMPSLYNNPIIGIKKIIAVRLFSLRNQIAHDPQNYLPNVMSRLIFVITIFGLKSWEMILFLFGFLSLILKIRFSFQTKQKIEMHYLALISFIVIIITILIFGKMGYDRHYLILLPYIYLIISYGIYSILQQTYIILKRGLSRKRINRNELS